MSPGVPVCVCVRGGGRVGVLLAMTCPLVVKSMIVLRVGILDHVLFVGENYRIWEGGGLSLL